MCWRNWPGRFLPTIHRQGRRLGSRATPMTALPMPEKAKQRRPVLLLARSILGTGRGVFLPGSITTGGVIALSPGLGGPELVV